ncbi:HAD-IA family hydrolase [Advenella sp. WQ 585]|uniref:HAD-IA family hydrolase n=1 Tax=Advenella mandrilli TaxID=2800330 RepID=A0ABS1EGI0_9BURK|nr:HAD-IA family hydrolase [Advenella mandrilli]MBK1782115.1 HAD-IA family hydrolase [Advenella mandrilli]MDY0272378.1 HAD-IA family hydrolase [Advenella sp.]
MRRIVFFDFDGTLVDSAPDLAHAANLQRIRKGLPPLQYATLRPYASQGARGLLGAALNLQPDHNEYEAVRQQFLHDYKNCMTTHSRLFNGINELLNKIDQNNMGWGIVTNKAEDLSFPMFDHFQLTSRSAANVCGDTTPYAKPHPAPLLHAARLANSLPEHCIYIGDDERDIIAGKAANMATIAVSYGYCNNKDSIQEWQADLTVNRVDELWNAIAHLAQKNGVKND